MPKKIILIRHGETDFNKEKIIQGQLDTFLNHEGLSAAQRIAEILREKAIEVIFSSDLKRAYHTAWIMSTMLQKPLIQRGLLRERHFGKLQGLRREEIKNYVSRFGDERMWSGGWLDEMFEIETDEQMKQRLHQFLTTIKKYKNKTIGVVTHGGTIRIFLHVFGFDKEFTRALPIKNTACIVLDKVLGKKDGKQYELQNQAESYTLQLIK